MKPQNHAGWVCHRCLELTLFRTSVAHPMSVHATDEGTPICIHIVTIILNHIQIFITILYIILRLNPYVQGLTSLGTATIQERRVPIISQGWFVLCKLKHDRFVRLVHLFLFFYRLQKWHSWKIFLSPPGWFNMGGTLTGAGWEMTGFLVGGYYIMKLFRDLINMI